MPALSMINISINVQSGKSCTLMRYIPESSLHTHADNTASATTCFDPHGETLQNPYTKNIM